MFILIFGYFSMCTFGCGTPETIQSFSDESIGKNNLVNILEADSTMFVELKYSTTDNFMNADVYGDLEICYLRQLPAQKLVMAHNFLKEDHPDLRFLIYDGLRPRSIQWTLWNTLDNVPESERTQFVANPKTGSIHNFGAAVDLTLADTLGNPLDMGTKYDYFGELAFPVLEDSLLAVGELTGEQVSNRRILRDAMEKAGFSTITTEWWHFNAFPYQVIKTKYTIIE
ncbi:MAG: M15 family metallopeptidase [Fidelibacterota bacterium]